ncbi:MAG: PilZ domain-containing protein [Phycisphaerae bacterium]
MVTVRPQNSNASSSRERRIAERIPVEGALWMLDKDANRIIRCNYFDASQSGMRLRIPVGYGVTRGQHVELHVQPPNYDSQAFGLPTSRPATIVRTRIVPDKVIGEMELGVRFENVMSRKMNELAPR